MMDIQQQVIPQVSKHAGGSVTILNVPPVGTTYSVTLNAGEYSFTYGTDFGGSTVNEIAQSLANACNGYMDGNFIGNSSVNRWIAARSKGAVCYFVALIPGTTGNVTLSTSGAANLITVSGATFTGGANSLSTNPTYILAQGAPVATFTRATANVGGTATVGARTTRRTAVISCPLSSVEPVFVGFATGVTAITGQELKPGQSISLDYNGALFFFGAAGTGIYNVIEISEV